MLSNCSKKTFPGYTLLWSLKSLMFRREFRQNVIDKIFRHLYLMFLWKIIKFFTADILRECDIWSKIKVDFKTQPSEIIDVKLGPRLQT